MQPDQIIKLLKYLNDALYAAQEIQINTLELTVKNYSQSATKWIVERGIEIISEGLKRASLIEVNLPITDINKIFSTRNKIAHEYDLVDPFILYNIVQKNIPLLIKELKQYIKILESN